MFTNSKIEKENAKTIRQPFDTEVWISDNYYNVHTRATIIKVEDGLGYVQTSIPGEAFYNQLISNSWQRVINLTDLLQIAKNRNYPLTYGYDASDYDASYKKETLRTEFHRAQRWHLSPNGTYTIPIKAVTSTSQKNRMLILAFTTWRETTEFTLTIGSNFSRTYTGKDIVNNNIIIDLYGIANTDTTATITWTSTGAALAAFTQNYIYYMNKRNLLSVDVSLRGDLKPNASTIPSSQINVQVLGDQDIYELYNTTYLFDNYVYYTCGYNDALGQNEGYIDSDPTIQYVIPRRFSINTTLKYNENVIEIEAEDSISELYNTSMGGVLYRGLKTSLFNDHLNETSDIYSFVTLADTGYFNFGQNIEKTGTGYITRFQFMFWLMFYAYFSTMWTKNKTIAHHIAREFSGDFRTFFALTNNTYVEYSDNAIYKDTTDGTQYQAAIDDCAPLPLMAWIQDTWHGNTTIKNRNNVDTNLFFRPKFVDAGRPSFSYNEQSPVIAIDEAFTANPNETIEIPKKYLIVPRRNLLIQYTTRGTNTVGSNLYADDADRETICTYTKEAGNTWASAYNYNGGFHYNVVGSRQFNYTSDKYANVRMNGTSGASSTLNYTGMLYNYLWFYIATPYNYGYMNDQGTWVTGTLPDTEDSKWEAKGYSPSTQTSMSNLTNSDVIDGDTVEISYDNYMGKIIDNTLTKQSILGRSNKTGQFTWRGDPRLQPRDIFTFKRLDGSSVNCTIENIETHHENGGTTQTITYREGIV